MKRFVRWLDVYLNGFELNGMPIWVPRDQACDYGDDRAAAFADRRAVIDHAYGPTPDDVVVVKVGK